MMRWIFIFVLSLVISGVAGHASAEEGQADSQSQAEPTAVAEKDQEMIEIAQMLELMEILEDLEFMEQLDLFIEETADEKDD
jgi:hypothetical protein